MKLTLLEVHNYKRLKDVTVEPGETNLILIGGKNTNGKSSLLGSMSAALGGKKEIADEPIRKGAKTASIRLVFDDGALNVRRKFTTKGSTIEVTNADGKISSPQKMLDTLVGPRFIDPMKFSRLSSIEQRKVLLGAVDLGIDLDASFAKEKAVFDERRDLNRDVKSLKVRVEDAFPVECALEHVEPADILSRIDELNAEADASKEASRILSGLVAGKISAEAEYQAAKDAFIAARNRISEMKKALATADADLKNKRDILQGAIDIDVSDALVEAREELSSCSANNAEVAAAKLSSETHERLGDELEMAEEAANAKTKELNAIKAKRAEALEGAEMPLENLTFDEDGLLLDGLPFSQASGAQKLIASISIAWKLKPDLQDIWVEDGALLDEDHIEELREYAVENDLRIWLERVGEADEEAIIMVDGEVKS